MIGARTKSTIKPFNLQIQVLNKFAKEKYQYIAGPRTCAGYTPNQKQNKITHMNYVGGFMADLAGRRSVLFPKIQREAGKKNQRYEIFGEESSLCEVLVW